MLRWFVAGVFEVVIVIGTGWSGRGLPEIRACAARRGAQRLIVRIRARVSLRLGLRAREMPTRTQNMRQRAR